MAASAHTASYGSWRSPITSSLIVAQSIGLSEITPDGEDVYWLELRPQEEGRSVVVRRAAASGAAEDLTPKPFSARTRVHEYGGGAWTVQAGAVFFSNDQARGGHQPDRRLYRQDRGGGPLALTADGPWRYADGLIDRRRNRWIGVREDHGAGPHPENTIVAVDLARPGADGGRILASGRDFFSSPRLSRNGQYLAWLAWDHPDMPWIGTSLHLAQLDDGGMPRAPTIVAGSRSESIFQPEWSPDGRFLTFVSDRTGWWNLYRYDVACGSIVPIAPMPAEFGQPQWLFGMSTYAYAGNDRIVASRIEAGLGRLAVIELSSGRLRDLDLPFSDFSSVRAEEDRVVFRAGAADRPASLVLLDLATGSHQVLKQSTAIADDPAIRRCFSAVQPVEFPTEAGRTAYGLFYPPFNPDYAAPAHELPPLVVRCHGGPTSAASSALNLGIQYWASRGIAVLDVNYGGSTGFGREYRERLHLAWGIVDVHDSINGARFLGQAGRIDVRRAVITGGSAGGYTALMALATCDFFAGGGSHFGVSDLAALARDTHKFESRYLDWLIGPYPQEAERYRARSPVAHAADLAKPVVFFQGEEDAIVPPSQTEMMVDALRARRIPVGYFLFAGEQHGFRRAQNIQRALDAELYFYAFEVFGVRLSF